LRGAGADGRGCRRWRQHDWLSWDLPLRLAGRSLDVIPLPLDSLPLGKPGVSAVNIGQKATSPGQTYHPSGSRGGGEDGPAVSAGASRAIVQRDDGQWHTR
jgi:hypothetical protein